MAQFLTQEKDIIDWLTEMLGEESIVIKEKYYTISSTGVVDIDGVVHLSHKNLTHLPIQFGKVTGNFDVSYNQLKSLEGSPSEAILGFNCTGNQLTSLVGGPSIVKKDYLCSYNQLTSLEGVAKEMNRLDASYNQITSLEHLPKVIGDDCILSYNPIKQLMPITSQIGGFMMLDKTEVMNAKWLRETLINTQIMALGLGFLEKPEFDVHFIEQINEKATNPYYKTRYFSHTFSAKQDLIDILEAFEEKQKLEQNIQVSDSHSHKMKL
jgi:hypothetical protein